MGRDSRPRETLPDRSLPLRSLLLIHLGLLALFVANALRAAVSNSAVCDELGAHIPAGFLYWTSGQWSGGLGNVPLGQLLIAAPPYWLGHSYELYTEQHLLLFRLPVIFMAALLGLGVAHLATRLYGQRAGIAAFFLYALSPNVLAHASLATLDLPAAFFIFLSLYALYFLVARPTPYRVFGVALAVTAALLTKVQAIALLGLVPAVLAFNWQRLSTPERRMPLLAAFVCAPLLIVVLINLVYLELPSLPSKVLAPWLWLPEQFVAAFKAKLAHGSRGHFGYLLGEYSTTGWWYYFPIAIGLKTPLPALVLIALGLFRRHSLATVAFVLAPIVVFFALGLVANVNIGLRHVLVIYPFLFLLAGRGAVALFTSRSYRFALGSLALGYVAQAIFISPHHLSYFNILVGGPTRGHYYLLDSNYDWGQNDHFLRRYVEASDTSYQIDPDPFQPSTGHILVNANALYGIVNGGADAYRWLENSEAVRQIAYTWFEFYLPDDPNSPDSPEGQNDSVRERDASARRALVEHLFALQDRYKSLEDPGYRIFLAQSFSFFGAHDVAFTGLRGVLKDHPTSKPALAAGGKLIVRFKLGVLGFEADQYLNGIQTARPEDPKLLPLPTLEEQSRSLAAGRAISRLYSVLASALVRQGQPGEARGLLKSALQLDPGNQFARKQLNRRR